MLTISKAPRVLPGTILYCNAASRLLVTRPRVSKRGKQRIAPVLDELPGTGADVSGHGPDTPDDAALMTAYAGGDLQAFETLYARHKGPLYRYMLRGCGREAAARDLFQDVWLKLIQARHRYQPTAAFTTWMYRIAHNHLADYHRGRKPVLDLPDDTAIPVREHPDARAAQQQSADVLLTAISRLPFEQREAILLREERGLSLDEIADITGVGRETVKSRLRYALAKLRNEIGGRVDVGY